MVANPTSADELPTIPIRSPAGNGWLASKTPTSNSSATVSTRITPDWANSAVIPAASGPATSRVASVRAGEASATIGFVRPIRRANRANLRGFPNDSR